MDSETVSLLSLGDSAPSSPNVPVVQPLVQTKVLVFLSMIYTMLISGILKNISFVADPTFQKLLIRIQEAKHADPYVLLLVLYSDFPPDRIRQDLDPQRNLLLSFSV